MAKPKSDDEFFKESLSFWVENSHILSGISPECTNEYHDHSLLKLIGFAYWVNFFNRITHTKLRVPHGYKLFFIDAMAGCGITTSKRSGDHFCGSCPGVLLSSLKTGYPFDAVIAVEMDEGKASVLEKRLNLINMPTVVQVLPCDINVCVDEIVRMTREKIKSFIILDPEGPDICWDTLIKLLNIEGDLILTWFEHEVSRLIGAAVTPKNSREVREKHEARLNALFGGDYWKSYPNFTDEFVARIMASTIKSYATHVKIPRKGGDFKLILFTKTGVQKQADEWQKNVNKRIQSSHGQEISKLLDVSSGRTSTLDNFL